MPLIFSWPGHIPENRTDTTHLVSGLDIMPSLCDYAGIRAPKTIRGKSFRAILEGKSVPWHDFIVTEVSSNRGRMVRTDRYKYVTYKDDMVEQLFDMRDDGGETKNLATSSKYASTLAEHRRMLKGWERRLDVAPNVPNAESWGRKG